MTTQSEVQNLLVVRVARLVRRRLWKGPERHGSCTPRLAVVTRRNGAPHATGIATEVALEPKTPTVVSLPRILKGPIVYWGTHMNKLTGLKASIVGLTHTTALWISAGRAQ